MRHYSRETLPVDGWREYRKTRTTTMVRIGEPFTVDTREGSTLMSDGGWLALDGNGDPYPIADDVHAESYEEA